MEKKNACGKIRILNIQILKYDPPVKYKKKNLGLEMKSSFQSHLKPIELLKLVSLSAFGNGCSITLTSPFPISCVYFVGHQNGLCTLIDPLSQINVNSFGKLSSIFFKEMKIKHYSATQLHIDF